MRISRVAPVPAALLALLLGTGCVSGPGSEPRPRDTNSRPTTPRIDELAGRSLFYSNA